jgi:ubiquinone/menaquinone biosynthesis C-methylase UbiE
MPDRPEPEATGVAAHYSSGSLLERIKTGLAALNASPPLDLDTLAMVDEFHIGGRQATVPFLKKLEIGAGDRVLDLGCGLGGPARFAARTTGAHITGIDLTDEFVSTGRALTDMTGLTKQVDLVQGSILDLPFEPASFDAAYMIHVGMNIADKTRIAAQAARMLKPGGVFGIYDVMRVGEGQMLYPVPWASEERQSALATPDMYRQALVQAGFTVESELDLRGFAKDFFAQVLASQSGAEGPPPLGLHLIMGGNTPVMMRNMVANISEGRISPTEIIARAAL